MNDIVTVLSSKTFFLSFKQSFISSSRSLRVLPFDSLCKFKVVLSFKPRKK